jgi:hypothetical protein
MLWQLRTYTMRPGAMPAFRDLWKDHIVPLRRELGFEIAGGWFDADADLFVWAVGHPAPDGWEAVERLYYDDPRRERLPVNPREYVASVQTRVLQEA